MKLFLALKKVQNHSSSGSHSPIKKFFLLAKYMIHLPQQGDTHLPPLSTIWKALIYKVVIVGSLVPAMGHLPKCMSCHKTILIINSMAHCFHEYT